ncbi:MAG: XdhC family protein [Bacteroidota bacterium]|nr:XdhC family protein [Bacteroidota bacterium]
MKEIHLWNFIYTHLAKNNSVVFIAVVHHEKGSPGKEGFKMAISSNGESIGSIGGGVMEYNIIAKCKEHLKKKTRINEIETLYHNRKTTVNRSGLICAGAQTNFTYSLYKKDIEAIREISDAVKVHNPGKIIFSQKGISFSSGKNLVSQVNFTFKSKTNWNYEEPVGTKNIVYVVGSGHVGLAVCKIMSILDFYIVVYDSRGDLQTLQDNKFADKKIIDSYKNLGNAVTEDSYIIIVTTGFESDKEAIKQVINKRLKYIGLMGTKAKIKKIFNEAVKDGIKKELLEKIHAPIGIDINSDTPEEIAISIAAEIIRQKNNS